MKKINTIKKYQEYKELFEIRNYVRNDIFTIYFRENNYSYTRIGLLVSKKNGIAVIRNKIKRQVRSIIDNHIDYKINKDMIIVISPKYDVENYEYNNNSLCSLLNKILGEINEKKF